MSIHSVITDYLREAVETVTEGAMIYNFSQEDPDTYSIVTRYADKQRKRYINGDADKEYGFEIVLVRPFSTTEDDLNLEAMELAQSLIELFEEKNRNRDFPELGEGKIVQEVEILQNMPNLSGINAEENLARYRIQGRVLYHELSMRGWE